MKNNFLFPISMLLCLVFSFSCSKESSDKEILSFIFSQLDPPVSGVISSSKIELTVPDETDITSLAPTIQISEKAAISPASGISQDFTDIVNYTVTAEDGTFKTYVASVHYEGEPSVEITWDYGAATPEKIAWGSAATAGDKLYLIGGTVEGNVDAPIASVYVYDPNSDTWDDNVSSLIVPRWAHSSVTVDGKIYVMGGLSVLLGPAIKVCEVYDPETDTWELITDMPRSRGAHGACVLNGKIYIIGGEEKEPASGTHMNFVDVYDPTSNSWSTIDPLPTPTMYLSAASANGKVYAIGGAIASGGEGVTTVFEYNVAKETWTQKSDIATPRWSLTANNINDLIFCIGGSTGGISSGTTRVEVYAPYYDICIQSTGLGVKCYGQATTVWNGKLYVFGGCISPPPTYETYTDATQIGTLLTTKN